MGFLLPWMVNVEIGLNDMGEPFPDGISNQALCRQNSEPCVEAQLAKRKGHQGGKLGFG